MLLVNIYIIQKRSMLLTSWRNYKIWSDRSLPYKYRYFARNFLLEYLRNLVTSLLITTALVHTLRIVGLRVQIVIFEMLQISHTLHTKVGSHIQT